MNMNKASEVFHIVKKRHEKEDLTGIFKEVKFSNKLFLTYTYFLLKDLAGPKNTMFLDILWGFFL